jgi:hypothetical protein
VSGFIPYNCALSDPVLRPFTYAMLSLASLQLLMIVLNCLLICHHPRDSVEQILVKSGVLVAPLHVLHDPQQANHLLMEEGGAPRTRRRSS